MSVKKGHPTKFRSPVRRLTRRRSGYKVSGKTTGGECKLKMAEKALVRSTSLNLTFEKDPVQLAPSFKRKLAFVAFCGYIFPTKNVELCAVIEYVGKDGVKKTGKTQMTITANHWGKFGAHCIFNMETLENPVGKILGVLKLSSREVLGETHFFGVDLNSVYYYRDKDVYASFNQKTHLYLPEIYYFDMDEPFVTKPKEYSELQFSSGRCVVLKSCNRCARYLLLDIENERNALSFSNHCISRAPCTHSSFSSYNVVENQCQVLPEYISNKVARSEQEQSKLAGDSHAVSIIKTHYGYQLECRSCKKFYVNAPLNPMRDSTQHREDSLRRRALEVLVDELLKRQWIYHVFRTEKQEEFDVHIWEKFGKKCFNCGRELSSPGEMDLDHTLPLSMLWPLDTTATCLCSTCNSQKRDKFPVEMYSVGKLKELAKITGLSSDLLHSKQINVKAIEELEKRIVWFFDKFLAEPDYQKARKGKRASDLIFKAVEAAIQVGGAKTDLVAGYVKITKHPPSSISID